MFQLFSQLSNFLSIFLLFVSHGPQVSLVVSLETRLASVYFDKALCDLWVLNLNTYIVSVMSVSVIKGMSLLQKPGIRFFPPSSLGIHSPPFSICRFCCLFFSIYFIFSPTWPLFLCALPFPFPFSYHQY